MAAASGSRTSGAKKQITKNSQFGLRGFKGPFLNVYTKHNQDRNRKALDFSPIWALYSQEVKGKGWGCKLGAIYRETSGKCQDIG